jgi:hypothetical protein
MHRIAFSLCSSAGTSRHGWAPVACSYPIPRCSTIKAWRIKFAVVLDYFYAVKIHFPGLLLSHVPAAAVLLRCCAAVIL